jgi:hypothetical protein
VVSILGESRWRSAPVIVNRVKHPSALCAPARARSQASPSLFKVTRDSTGEAVGFYIGVSSDKVPQDLVKVDPVVALIFGHLQVNPLPTSQRAVVYRKWLGREKGEAPSLVQAACWLDMKRTYVEMRRSLRRVYTSAWNVGHYEQICPCLVSGPCRGV